MIGGPRVNSKTMRKILFISLLVCLSALSFGQGIMGGTVASSGETGPVNIISNGTFDDGSDWTAGGGWSIGSGVATFDDVTAGGLVQSDADMVSSIQTSTDYQLTFDITGGGGSGAYLLIRSANGNVQYISGFTYYAAGSYALDFTTPSDVSGGGIDFFAGTQASATYDIDNITLIQQ